MKKFVLVFLVLALITTASAKTATFQTDQTQQVTINNEQVNLELIGVDNYDDYPDMYSATFIDGNDMTITVTSWNAHQNDYVQSRVNGEYVGLMNWNGAETDSNTDDTATLAWGNAYFPCESYQTGENEIKWCSDDNTKEWEVGGETVNYEFMYVRETSGDPQVKQAVFLNEQGATVTISSQNAQEYGYTQDQINGRTVYAKVVRGAGTDRGSDDAVVLKKEEKTTCTYDFVGNVRKATSNGEIHVAGGFTTLAQDNSFGFTKTADCGSTAEVKYKENGETIATKNVTLPEQNSEVNVTLEVTYDMRDYATGEKVTLNPKEGLKFQGNSFYFDKVTETNGEPLMEAYSKAVVPSTQFERYRSNFFLLGEGGTTVNNFENGEYTVAVCSIEGQQVNVAIKDVANAGNNWPESSCSDSSQGQGYNTRTANNIKNLIGGPVRDVKPKTEIKFGNNAQNTLYVHEISGDYMREVKVTMSARNKDGEKFRLNWDSMVKGQTKQFNSGSYTVHLCGDSSPQKLKISISKKEGMSGYGACFTDKVADEGSFEAVDYQIGEIADVTQGDVLVFGPNNNDRLYIENINLEQNIDRYSIDAYANRLFNFKSVLPVAGTVTEAYFYSGRYPVHFCSFQNDQAKVVVSDQGVASSEACQENIPTPDGTVNAEADRIPTNSPLTVTTEINTQGTYKLKASINGDQFTSKTIDQTGRANHQLNSPGEGNVTVNLVAPGSWWNPLDSTEIVSQDVVQIYTPEQEQGPSCQEMIDNAQQNAEGKICGQITSEMSCSSGDRTYTAKDTCEISYLKDRGWETSGNSDQQEAEIYAEGNISKGKILNMTVKNAEGLRLKITGPQTEREFSVSSSVQVFNIDTEELPAGAYTAKILPKSQGGLLAGIIGDLIGGPIYSLDFQVREPAEWKSYCSQNGYSTATADGKISCIENQIVPNCFTENAGEQCINVAEDVCEDLLGYGFNQTSATCQPM